MVRLCFALSLLHEHQDHIHMPRGFMDDPEGVAIAKSILGFTRLFSAKVLDKADDLA